VKSPIPDADGYRLIWFHSSHKRERDTQSRQDHIVRACKELDVLKAKLEGPRSRYSTLKAVELAVSEILANTGTGSWMLYQIQPWQKESYRQERRGRPGKDTRWRRRVKMCFRLSWEISEEKVRQDALSDGIFPLLTNCDDLSFLEILTAYKTKQPLVEKRHDLLKNTLEVTPAYLKSISRLEAFLFMSFVGITVHALIERELRKAMEVHKLEALPLYPENRECRAPTMARLIEVFGNLQRHILSKAGEMVQRFDPELTELQQQILGLLRLSPRLFSIDH
jgi:transposase